MKVKQKILQKMQTLSISAIKKVPKICGRAIKYAIYLRSYMWHILNEGVRFILVPKLHITHR